MNTKYKIIIAFAVFLLVFSSCADSKSFQKNEQNKDAYLFFDTALETKGDEPVFAGTADDFINLFNMLWRTENKSNYLNPVSEWQSCKFPSSIHYNGECNYYYFTENEKIWSLPSIAIYTPVNSDNILQVTVSFDDHSFSEQTYELYEKLCYYTIKTFISGITDAQAENLCSEINKLAYDNMVSNGRGYDSTIDIPVAYSYNTLIVYPYFAAGDMVRFTIIPADDTRMSELENKGTQMIEIKENL